MEISQAVLNNLFAAYGSSTTYPLAFGEDVADRLALLNANFLYNVTGV